MSIRITNGAMVKWKNSLKGIMSDKREQTILDCVTKRSSKHKHQIMDLFLAKEFLWQTLPMQNLPRKKVYKFGQQNSVRVTVVATTTVERQKGRNIVSKLIQRVY